MYNDSVTQLPASYVAIQAAGQSIGFSMPSDLQTGALLQTLAASKPKARLLELGTGTGLSTAWLLAGMDADSTLISIDSEPTYQSIAQQQLGNDRRLRLVCADAHAWLADNEERFDLIFADAWPGKYTDLDKTLSLLNTGGLYVIDDMLPQPNWPAGHGENADRLVADIEAKPGFQGVKLAWSTGIMLVVKQ